MKKNAFYRKKITVCLFLALFILFSSAFSGCSGQKTIDVFYLNTTIHIESYKNEISKSTKTEIEKKLAEIENSFSINKKSSFVYKFNNIGEGQSITLNSQESDVLKKAIEYYDKTDNLFNVAIYPLKELWQSKNPNGQKTLSIPQQNEIESAKALCDLETVLTFDDSTDILTKNVNGAKIDFGGFVKGYALDMIVSVLKDGGIVDGYVSIGSSSIYIFNVNSLSIRNPRNNAENILKINANINGKSVSTSGDYENYFGIQDGKYYSHILSANTGFPTDTGVISATVIGNNGAKLDALSTTLMLLDYDTLISDNALLNEIKENNKVFIVFNNGTKKEVLTNEQENNFTLLDSNYQIKKI